MHSLVIVLEVASLRGRFPLRSAMGRPTGLTAPRRQATYALPPLVRNTTSEEARIGSSSLPRFKVAIE